MNVWGYGLGSKPESFILHASSFRARHSASSSYAQPNSSESARGREPRAALLRLPILLQLVASLLVSAEHFLHVRARLPEGWAAVVALHVPFASVVCGD